MAVNGVSNTLVGKICRTHTADGIIRATLALPTDLNLAAFVVHRKFC